MASPGPTALPAGVRAQLGGLVAGLVSALPGNLVGVYLHGSLALGCFNAERSDVDALVVSERRLDAAERQALGPVLLGGSGPKTRSRTPPFPLELSVLAATGKPDRRELRSVWATSRGCGSSTSSL